MQVHAYYMVDKLFQLYYVNHLHDGKDYLDSKHFRVTYPHVTPEQAKMDRISFYGMLVSSNRKDGEKKNLLKYQGTADGICTWIDFLNDYE